MRLPARRGGAGFRARRCRRWPGSRPVWRRPPASRHLQPADRVRRPAAVRARRAGIPPIPHVGGQGGVASLKRLGGVQPSPQQLLQRLAQRLLAQQGEQRHRLRVVGRPGQASFDRLAPSRPICPSSSTSKRGSTPASAGWACAGSRRTGRGWCRCARRPARCRTPASARARRPARSGRAR